MKTETVKERIKSNGSIHVPPQLMKISGFSNGTEVYLKAEESRLVIEPVQSIRRMRLNAEIVDELVEYEELFEPELAFN